MFCLVSLHLNTFELFFQFLRLPIYCIITDGERFFTPWIAIHERIPPDLSIRGEVGFQTAVSAFRFIPLFCFTERRAVGQMSF